MHGVVMDTEDADALRPNRRPLCIPYPFESTRCGVMSRSSTKKSPFRLDRALDFIYGLLMHLDVDAKELFDASIDSL